MKKKKDTRMKEPWRRQVDGRPVVGSAVILSTTEEESMLIGMVVTTRLVVAAS